jgi:hypothetical protein
MHEGSRLALRSGRGQEHEQPGQSKNIPVITTRGVRVCGTDYSESRIATGVATDAQESQSTQLASADERPGTRNMWILRSHASNSPIPGAEDSQVVAGGERRREAWTAMLVTSGPHEQPG